MAYYTCREHLEALYNATDRRLRFHAHDAQAHEMWCKNVRTELSQLAGMDRMHVCEPHLRVLDEVACEGYVRRKLLINTEAGVSMPFYMLVPNDLEKDERRSAIIACHGHSSNGKEAVAGVLDGGVVERTIRHYNYHYGEKLVQMGYIVFAPDARGFGERREYEKQGDAETLKMDSSCEYLSKIAMGLGQTVIGMWTWDLMRLVDFALNCREVNGHIASVGLSGGGMQSLWLGAMDARIECCVVSGYFYGYKEALLINDNCACNYVPHLWENVDIGDIGALVAPRPVLVETGNQDPLNGRSGLKNVIDQIATVRKAMRLYGCEDRLFHDIFDGEHMWHGEKAYDWLLKYVPPILEDE